MRHLARVLGTQHRSSEEQPGPSLSRLSSPPTDIFIVTVSSGGVSAILLYTSLSRTKDGTLVQSNRYNHTTLRSPQNGHKAGGSRGGIVATVSCTTPLFNHTLSSIRRRSQDPVYYLGESSASPSLHILTGETWAGCR